MKKVSNLNIRVSPADLKKLKKAAKSAKVTASEFIRQFIQGLK